MKPKRKTPRAKPKRAPAPEGTRREETRRAFQPSALFVGSVEKGLRVLTAFDVARRPMRLGEIAQATGFDMSAAQRFTATLESLGFLRKDEFKRYHVTFKVFQLGFAYLQSETSIDTAMPFLQEAHRACEESINFTQMDGTDVVYVVRLPSLHAVSAEMSVGARLPAYCTAAGRVILAQLPPAQVLDILQRSDRARLTAHTKTDLGEILDAIERARRDGVAVASHECFIGDLSTAAPVFDGAGQVLGAVNIAVPASRWTLEQVRARLSPLIARTAAAISAAQRARTERDVAARQRAAAG